MMSAWKNLKIYGASPWWKPRNNDGVITKKGRFQHFEWYHIAYALAARELLEGHSLVKVALPIAYMQRHSLELAIKACTSMAYEIVRMRKAYETLEFGPQGEPELSHKYSVLLKEAHTALGAVDEILPEEFEGLARKFDRFDDGHPDRMRYDRYLPGGRKKPLQESFEGNVQLDILRRQEALEYLLETHLHWDPMHIDEAETVYARLAERMWARSQAVGEKLHELGLL